MDWLATAVAVSAAMGASGALLFRTLSLARDDRRREQTLLRTVQVPPDVGTPSKDDFKLLSVELEKVPTSDDEVAKAAKQRLSDHLRSLEHRIEGLEAEPVHRAHEGERDDFPRLWEDAQARLAKYHELAVIQGRQSFRMLLLFSALGFGLLAVVVWRAAAVETTAGGVALGTASAAGGALTAFISRTFMRAYRDANARLIDYFAEPLDMSRLLASERLLVNVDDRTRDEATLQIIRAALAPRLNLVEHPPESARRRTVPDADRTGGLEGDGDTSAAQRSRQSDAESVT